MSDLVTIPNTPNLSFFAYGANHLRTFNDGEIAFCLSDVLNAMKSTTTTTQAQSLISEGLGDGYNIVITVPDSIGRSQDTAFVREAALTFLLSRSRTASGKGLNKLIHTEILPSIRKTGKYEIAPVAPVAPAIPTNFREAMLLAINIEDSRLLLQAQIDGDADLVGFAKAIQKGEENILIGTMAKSLGDIGPSNLMSLLRDKKILITSTNPALHNLPYQRYIDPGYFVVEEGAIEVNNKTRLTFTTKITPKGQIWLAKKYYEWQNLAA